MNLHFVRTVGVSSVCSCVHNCPAGGMSRVAVDLSQSEPFSQMRCGVAGQYFIPGKINHIECARGSEGRFVTITPTEKDHTLSLNEVQVYGEEGTQADFSRQPHNFADLISLIFKKIIKTHLNENVFVDL